MTNSVVNLAGAVHFDMDGGLAGINLYQGGLGLVEEADEVEAGLGYGTGNGKAPAATVLDVVERLADVLGIVDSERNDLVETVELRDELRSEEGRELPDSEGAVAVGGAAGVDKTADYVLVNGLEFA
jgi:hypothetical protein